MTTDYPIAELDRKGLREFGLVTGAIVAGLFGLFFPWLLGRDLPIWPWVIFAVLTVLGLLVPLALRPVYRVWMRFGLLASRVTTPLILGIVYYLVISPMAYVRKLFGHDAMARSFDSDTLTYRTLSKRRAADSLENPF